jgi:hypothetical protein
MHLDSWYRAPIAGRASSPNRICINLGSNRRYLVFVNLTLRGMMKMCEVDLGVLDSTAPATLIRLFMSKFVDYPVIRISIDPGAAYIAPTENLLHDGSTFGMLCSDVTLTIRGRFGLRSV